MAEQVPDDAPAFTSKDGATRRAEGERSERSVSGATVTINKPRDELYRWYRDFSNLPQVMENVETITVADSKRSHWKVSGPVGAYEWDAVVTEDVPGEVIAWESEDGDVKNSGRVTFAEANPGRGTVVTAIIAYNPPGGLIGKAVAKLTQKEPAIQARRDLRRWKQLMEAGEIATSTPPNPDPKS